MTGGYASSAENKNDMMRFSELQRALDVCDFTQQEKNVRLLRVFSGIFTSFLQPY